MRISSTCQLVAFAVIPNPLSEKNATDARPKRRRNRSRNGLSSRHLWRRLRLRVKLSALAQARRHSHSLRGNRKPGKRIFYFSVSEFPLSAFRNAVPFPRMIHTAVEQLTWPVLSTYTRSGSSLTRSGERDEPRWLQLNPER